MAVDDTCSSTHVVDFNPPSCSDPPTGCSGGQGGGTLTGQMIAAKLNVALSEDGATPAGFGDFILPACLCTSKCPAGRKLNESAQQQQGEAVGVEDGLTTVNDLLALADQALSRDCSSVGTCTNTDGTAFAPPDPIRISTIENSLRAVNECFDGGASVIACSPTACP
jgi:hypothetical protein